MKPVLQENINKDTGDCLKACVASLLELPLDAVPNFQVLHHMDRINWFHAYWYFMCWFNYDVVYCDDIKEIVNHDGLDGLFIASVDSQAFEGATHAVIINKKLEVIHDPNPNNRPPYNVTAFDIITKRKT